MPLTESQRAFLENNHAAAMITIAKDGMPRAVRVGVALVDGKLWSSGTQDRVRTARLRRDPRCTLFVFDKQYAFLTLETAVNILDGPDAPELNLRLMRLMQNKPTGPLNWFGQVLEPDAFRQKMVEQKRLVYEFEISRAYGMA
ncbi:MAG: pyridoxamine 5'-phosphate oxidase family protein [Anaerolineaceae bacterium]|nr:pyridoxamine 5'-phosphate oxidase family protein [Anaerolineaceae bacterium]